MSCQIASFDVALTPTIVPENQAASQSAPFHPSTITLPKGFRKSEKNAAFPVETLFERDVAVPMRDGTKLYCDIFRPTGKTNVTAILVWSPYGKGGNGPHGLHMIEGRFGVPEERLSGYEKFEGLDPADWVGHDYAIVNFDLRGCWNSEGDIPWLGSQDGRDGYDAIEYVAQLEWCNGKVALAGNSWLAMSQWFIAAEQPPHLAAFAPWEGASDFYRDTLARGGVPYPYQRFWKILESSMVGRGKVEAITKMLTQYPLFNGYWEDKVAKLERVTAPCYVLASYSTSLHTSGSIGGFNSLGSKEKWLRVHPKQEWSDLYSDASTKDLRRFLDFYTKDVGNGWPSTPRVRVSLLPFNDSPVENIAFNSYPVPQTRYTKLFLTGSGELCLDPPVNSSQLSYRSDLVPTKPDHNPEELLFSYKFQNPTWLVGYSKAVLHISAEIAQDLDVFVQLRKMNNEGELLQHLNVPLDKLVPPNSSAEEVPNSCFLKYLGPTGVLRATHAGTLIPSSDPHAWPRYTHDQKEKAVKPNQIYRLEVPIWPSGMTFEAGESLVLKVAGHYMSMMEFEFLNHQQDIENVGRHTLHLGNAEASYLIAPFVEPI
ncbi:alpha/beta-hydrolase [Aspergillus affinis]|uniref:alpha/beta-hydrolase n=1 Tax=Aspergillus affinis TaxID=1070780 RepID=UPI0022FEFC95|nr:alpha/beta-hydrolase [Aspergillus affinis]KAI9037632.1 alpha/beta-hydrolase [Aspergillus affinis]